MEAQKHAVLDPQQWWRNGTAILISVIIFIAIDIVQSNSAYDGLVR